MKDESPPYVVPSCLFLASMDQLIVFIDVVPEEMIETELAAMRVKGTIVTTIPYLFELTVDKHPLSQIVKILEYLLFFFECVSPVLEIQIVGERVFVSNELWDLRELSYKLIKSYVVALVLSL